MDLVEKEDFFVLSSVTITELEEIKTNRYKDDAIKYAAREAVRFLNDNQDKYQIIIFDDLNIFAVVYGDVSKMSNDEKILYCAQHAKNEYTDLIFVSDDILARMIAITNFGLEAVKPVSVEKDQYKGYVEVVLTDEELADLYSNLTVNHFNLLVNQYLLIKNKDNKIVDTFKWTESGYDTIRQKPFKSNMFGTLKPLDEVQKCAMDSLVNNDITVLYGRAGSGKTTLPLNYIMQGLEKGTFKKCYIIYSYEPLKGAKTLGYEKGDHITKLLYSASLGNILASKFGDIQMVERMIDLGQIEIIPTANIRGVEIGEDSVCFCTETQNLDIYTLKTIIQRCKDGCKQIYEGDIIEQKDTNITTIGISRLIEVFKGHPKFGCIKLKNNYRGELTELADKM